MSQLAKREGVCLPVLVHLVKRDGYSIVRVFTMTKNILGRTPHVHDGPTGPFSVRI